MKLILMSYHPMVFYPRVQHPETRFTFPARTEQPRFSDAVETCLETWGVWKCGVRGASRCMHSAVACHFSDNWSALRDRCLSATVGLHSCLRVLLSEGGCGHTARPHSTVWEVNFTCFNSNQDGCGEHVLTKRKKYTACKKFEGSVTLYLCQDYRFSNSIRSSLVIFPE